MRLLNVSGAGLNRADYRTKRLYDLIHEPFSNWAKLGGTHPKILSPVFLDKLNFK